MESTFLSNVSKLIGKDININIIEDINHDVDEISDIKIDRRKSCN